MVSGFNQRVTEAVDHPQGRDHAHEERAEVAEQCTSTQVDGTLERRRLGEGPDDGGDRASGDEDGGAHHDGPVEQPRRDAKDLESPNMRPTVRIERDMAQRTRPRFLKPRATRRRTA